MKKSGPVSSPSWARSKRIPYGSACYPNMLYEGFSHSLVRWEIFHFVQTAPPLWCFFVSASISVDNALQYTTLSTKPFHQYTPKSHYVLATAIVRNNIIVLWNIKYASSTVSTSWRWDRWQGIAIILYRLKRMPKKRSTAFLAQLWCLEYIFSIRLHGSAMGSANNMYRGYIPSAI